MISLRCSIPVAADGLFPDRSIAVGLRLGGRAKINGVAKSTQRISLKSASPPGSFYLASGYKTHVMGLIGPSGRV
jgi:hypothetical protein